jgi:hypothetical protein
MSKPLSLVATLVGILLVVLAIVYWTVPAQSLPAFLPGYEAGAAAVHVKHGIASAVVGVVLIAFGWFSGRRA